MTEAAILGIICGVMPGPVLSATFTEVLQSGYLKCLRIILLAMLVETIVALTSLIAFSIFHLSEMLFQGLSLIGACILFWLAASIWKINKITGDDKLHFSFGKIAAMILSNGVLWTYWIAVCIPRAVQLGRRMPFGQYAFVAIAEMGWLVATLATAYLFSRFRRWLSDPKFVPVMFKVFALTFVYFALSMSYQSVAFFAG